MTVTCIKDASWVVAWDPHLRQHYFRNRIDVAFDGDRIVHVRLDYVWDMEKGRRDFADALQFVDAAARHPSGRLGGMLAPAQVDTCSPELLRESLAAARQRGMKMTVHCSQHIPEFQEMVRRHG